MSRKRLLPTPNSFDAVSNLPKGKEETYKNLHALKLAHAVNLEEPQQQPSNQLTLLPAASLASLSVLPGSDRAIETTVISGRRCSGSLKSTSPLGCLAKTLLVSSAWRSTRCYLTWRTQVMKSRHLLYRLVPSTPGIDEIESGLWRTPEGGDSANREMACNSRNEAKLSAQVKLTDKPPKAPVMLPSPQAREQKNHSRSATHEIMDRTAITVRDSWKIGADNYWSIEPELGRVAHGIPIGCSDLKHSETL